jgi:hypothetical protein
MQSFITDSPFSFRNPIFFSVPRDQNTYCKKVNPVQSKRQLFNGDDSTKSFKNDVKEGVEQSMAQ